MTWKDPASVSHDALIAALHEASTRITHAITQGFKYMADAQTQALADLSAAVTAMANEITVAVNEIASLIAANQNVQPDDSAAIEAQVTAIKNATSALTAAIPPAAPATPPATPPAQ
jgi:hypothetical protein